jgi:glycyl-tRNA synthetase beta chain
MPRLLFEIGTEELPAWYVAPAVAALSDGFRERCAAIGLGIGEVHPFATPRRLALLVEVDFASARRLEVRRGPAEGAAFDADGKPTRAATGFAASCGVPVAALEIEATPKGRYLVARREVGGEAAATLLPDLLAGLVRDLPAKRKMRWGSVETPFVRPIAWLTALLDDAELPVVVAGLAASRSTRGHRFLHPAPLALAHADDYPAALRGADVIADRVERAKAVRAAVAAVAAAAGGLADAAAPLVEEIVDLVEQPVALMGSIDEVFLALPDEVLTTVMIHHQRFVPVRDSAGKLLPRFVAVANHRVANPALVAGGYERVLAGRLHDARFFWEADRRKSLSQHAWSLAGIAFQKQLGSMADKVSRVATGATAIAALLGLSKEERSVLDAALPLFRADLATEMVGELPELEGTMGRAYSLADGAPADVARALEDGVLPRTPEDRLPHSRVGAVLAVADRLDKLLGFFAIGRRPTGSADPFALRRDAVSLARVLSAHGWRVALRDLVVAAAGGYREGPVEVEGEVIAEVVAFLWDRVAALLGERGFDTPTVRAAIGSSVAVIGAVRRAHLLRALAREVEFEALQSLYKRAANLAEHARPGVDLNLDLLQEVAEMGLANALPAARAGAAQLIEAMHAQIPASDLGGDHTVDTAGLVPIARQVLTLKGPLDAFLDEVMVMVEEEGVRVNRLALLAQVAVIVRSIGAIEHLAS